MHELVVRGWVDIQTPDDGPVTTVVMGNCGVGFAPATLVAGALTQQDGKATGAMPGRLIRGPQAA